MADKKISELPDADLPLDGTELVAIVQSGVTKRVLISEIGNDVFESTIDVTRLNTINLTGLSGTILLNLTSANAGEVIYEVTNYQNVNFIYLCPEIGLDITFNMDGNFLLSDPSLTCYGNNNGFLKLYKLGDSFKQEAYIDRYEPSNPALFGEIAQYIDGTIVGNEFIDKSGNGRNLDIINNDITVRGFPYKSGAMVAQKIANFGLIPDPTNFWFTAGIPNQIPVVSFFQNIDYSNQIFSRHSPQVLDGNGVEVYEPRVLEIVTYNSVLSGANLTSANTYFSSPAIDPLFTNVPGNYATNTAAISAVSAGTTVYNKSGTKTEPAQLVVNKVLPVKGIGYSINNYTSVPANLVTMNQISSIERLILGGNGAISIGFRLFANTCVIEKVKMFDLSAGNGFFQEAGTSTIIRNCVFTQTINKAYFLQAAPNVLVDGCYIRGDFNSGMFTANAANTETQTVQYCKIITSVGITVNQATLVFNFNYNNVSVANISNLFRPITANCILNVKRNITNGTGTTGITGGYLFSNFPATGTFNFEYNRHTTNDGEGIFFAVATSKDSVVRGNYVRLLSCQVFYTAVGNSALVEGNTFVSYGTGIAGTITSISISSAVGATTKNIIVQKNKVLNPKYFNQSLGGYHNCIYIRDYLDTVVKYNYTAGAGEFNIIMKSTTAMDNTECPVMYNISHLNGILAKGLGFVKFYNNTVVDSLKAGITMTVADDLTDLKTTYAKNNIVVNNVNNFPLVDIISEIPAYKHQVDYNLYYSTDPTPFKYLGVPKTFAQWQALGYDLNSRMLTTLEFADLFEDYANRDFRTKTNYLTGVNLGVAYNTGLDKSTNWGTDTQIPTVVTKTQPASWNVGAYIQ